MPEIESPKPVEIAPHFHPGSEINRAIGNILIEWEYGFTTSVNASTKVRYWVIPFNFHKSETETVVINVNLFCANDSIRIWSQINPEKKLTDKEQADIFQFVRDTFSFTRANIQSQNEDESKVVVEGDFFVVTEKDISKEMLSTAILSVFNSATKLMTKYGYKSST